MSKLKNKFLAENLKIFTIFCIKIKYLMNELIKKTVCEALLGDLIKKSPIQTFLGSK